MSDTVKMVATLSGEELLRRSANLAVASHDCFVRTGRIRPASPEEQAVCAELLRRLAVYDRQQQDPSDPE